MVVQLSGELLLRLMRLDRAAEIDAGRLAHGPAEPPAARPVTPSAPCGSSPNTARRSRW